MYGTHLYTRYVHTRTAPGNDVGIELEGDRSRSGHPVYRVELEGFLSRQEGCGVNSHGINQYRARDGSGVRQGHGRPERDAVGGTHRQTGQGGGDPLVGGYEHELRPWCGTGRPDGTRGPRGIVGDQGSAPVQASVCVSKPRPVGRVGSYGAPRYQGHHELPIANHILLWIHETQRTSNGHGLNPPTKTN